MKTTNLFTAALFISINLIVAGKYLHAQPQNETIKDKDGNTYTIKTLPNKSQWMTKNLNIEVADSWCYDDNPNNCNEYGRLYTFQSALNACPLLGKGWRLPTNKDWESMVALYGGVRDKSTDGGKAAFKAMINGGNSGFDILLGGNREADGKSYTRLKAHGFYWTATENPDGTAWFYNLGAGGQIVNRHEDGDKRQAVSVRCVRTKNDH